ncbi:LPS export ABC transporter permease LptF [Litoreibacter roseus]|uniref:LPS export ABC transporter permease LptF n=1 Tax=Litoreibacter roseus TaxID=2601869 RepID=A0A6N6JD23_9RHOB|nr:LPS export ABC transporter permease LptF [Litoreibacter roseus]GFE64055.1 LPS export ABC transporter permease LptF [Litoreibacter roseus]
MARFDRYMLSQLLVLFGFFSLILVSVYWVNRALSLFDDLISDGQSAFVFLEFTLLTLPYVILVVLPISGFVAALYVTNRLASESELVVLQTSGASAFRIARPVLYFGLVVAVLVAVLGHILVPAARTELAGRSEEVSRDVTARFLKEGRFMHPSDDVALYIQNITERGELEELFLEDSRVPEAVTTYTAKRALIVRSDGGPRLVMFDGLAQTFQPEVGRLSTVAFTDFTYDIAGLVSGGGSKRRDVRELPTAVLLNPTEADLSGTRGDRATFRYEAHDRFAKSLLSIAVPLIGFSTLLVGGFSRFGVWRQVIAAVVLVIFTQIIANTSEDIARDDIGLFWLAYMAPLFGFLVAVTLMWFSGRVRHRKAEAQMA